MKTLKVIENNIIKYIIIEKNNLKIKDGKITYMFNNHLFKENNNIELEIVEMYIIDRYYSLNKNEDEKLIALINDKEEIVYKHKNNIFFHTNKG